MIYVVDIFAGPGGLSEGFANFETRIRGSSQCPFKVAVSAEMDPAAHQTLLLRAFFRQFKSKPIPREYYDFLANPSINTGDPKNPTSFASRFPKEWKAACEEALNLRLGLRKDNASLYSAIRDRIPLKQPWVLIGGPPCQAYSLVGRSRNRGKEHYRPSRDKRHFLYREYLHILDEFRPDAFIMENVKGLLSSKVKGEKIFGRITNDLMNPGRALGKKSGAKYQLIPLGMNWKKDRRVQLVPRDYLLFSERHGVPQTRHRVILLGIRSDHRVENTKRLPLRKWYSVQQAWAGLPALRSGLSKSDDSGPAWAKVVGKQCQILVRQLRDRRDLADVRKYLASLEFDEGLQRGAVSVALRSVNATRQAKMPSGLARHILDARLSVALNHESRGHMATDLRRYLFCIAYSKCRKGRSPVSRDFPAQLAPKHASWKTGNFADRFRVHASHKPSGTITSHIAKDGHYFIHHDVAQCRTMTVREAARLQTFPDNYFFLGNRSQQFTQVGNAVPPVLARQIAMRLWQLLNQQAVR